MGILDRFSLKGRTALVTGAGSGIGRQLAIALGEAGADVAVADIDPESARDTAAEIDRTGTQSLSIHSDVTEASQVDSMVDSVLDAWGRLDIAVNNAGTAWRTLAEEMPEEMWDSVINVNLKSVFLCCQTEGRVMLGQGAGAIINVASISARIVNRPQQQVNYNASKAGVLHLTRSFAAEWAARGVRVNSISPGHALTPMTAGAPEEMRAEWVSNTPMGRLGQPEDFQGAVVFLASDAAGYVTGHDVVIDGGYTLW